MSLVRKAQRLSALTRPIFRVGRSCGKEVARGGPVAVEGVHSEARVFYPYFQGSRKPALLLSVAWRGLRGAAGPSLVDRHLRRSGLCGSLGEGMSHILVVDDYPMIREVLDYQLSREGFEVTVAADAEEMRKNAALRTPDLVILDLVLPDTDGLTLARELRGESDVGIIMLTGKGDTVDKVVGLEIGADDYITKPFQKRELLARVHTLLRRIKQNRDTDPKDDQHIIEFNGWRLNLLGHELRSPEGMPVYLTNYEFRLLTVLAERPNRALNREQILNLVDNRDLSPYDRSVDVLIGKLRRKIEENPKNPALIKTIRGIGYKFTVQTKRYSDAEIAVPDTSAAY